MAWDIEVSFFQAFFWELDPGFDTGDISDDEGLFNCLWNYFDMFCGQVYGGADKDEILTELASKYKGNYWIEDKPTNLKVGIELGLRGILLEHGHNMTYKKPGYIAKNWQEIYNLVTNQAVT